MVLSSTWGSRSLDGRLPGLALQLAAELPLDRYALVLALHPNVWHWHSPYQVRAWMAPYRRAGVALLPPEEGWQAAVVAADLVVGDHGSVMFYAAAADRPIAFAVVEPSELDPASPMARLLVAAPRLDPSQPLRHQLDAVIRDPQHHRYVHLTAEASSAPGQSAALIRALLYEQLRLPEPSAPARTPIVPIPRSPDPTPVTATVMTTVHHRDVVAVERYPAALRLDDPPDGVTHLSVAWRHDDPQLLAAADTVVATIEDTAGRPRRWIRSALGRLPGCTLAAVALTASTSLIGTRSGQLFVARVTVGAPDAACVTAGVLALLANRSTPPVFTLVVGARRHRVRLTPVATTHPARIRTRRTAERERPDH
ncbi:hypothetical protein SAMN05443668_104614 [Cryptosporangium aurantiacum]|uniref:Uncharacterized protein n=1 Tax=Cryptosporangium aurantiacum TaxID=134849 RepID=A0A1M7QFV6_9ACTN|nr:hypothetical protein SAMN05443668_104614 [Cryptosporangium aurantiacum]